MILSGQSKYHRNGDKINTNNIWHCQDNQNIIEFWLSWQCQNVVGINTNNIWHCQDNQNIIEMETKLIPTTLTLSGQSKYHRNGDKINTNNIWHCQDNQNIIEMETKLIPTTHDTVRTIKIS